MIFFNISDMPNMTSEDIKKLNDDEIKDLYLNMITKYTEYSEAIRYYFRYSIIEWTVKIRFSDATISMHEVSTKELDDILIPYIKGRPIRFRTCFYNNDSITEVKILDVHRKEERFL